MDETPDATITTATSVNVESGDGRDDGVISEPSRLVANILWLVLVLTCSLVALASAAALLLDFLAPSQQVGGSKEVTRPTRPSFRGSPATGRRCRTALC